MKIAAIGKEGSRKAIAARSFSPGVEWVWVDSVDDLERHRDAVLYADLDFRPEKDRIERLGRLLPAPVLIDSVVHTLAKIGRPFIRINGWPGLLERAPCELAVSDTPAEARVGQLFNSLGWPCRFVPDIPGMISGRILATIINEAYYTLQDRVSTRAEIDEAMRLGTGYPFGPFEWGSRIGLTSIFSLLGALSGSDSRYIPAAAMEQELHGIKI